MRVFIYVFCFLISGCASWLGLPPKNGEFHEPRSYDKTFRHEVTDNQPPGPYRDSPIFLSCDYKHPFEGDSIAAGKSYQFALMSSNAYHTEPAFSVSGWRFHRHYRGSLFDRAETGFQADVYVREMDGVVHDVAIAFRGTDTKADMYANAGLFWGDPEVRAPAQYQLARAITNKVRAEFGESKSYYFTGHSLGAALAFHASWRVPNAVAYGFDPSPRLWVGHETPAQGGVRFVVTEKGEFLSKYLSWWLGTLGRANPIYDEYDFIIGNAVREHNMYYLARGLLLKAVSSASSSAIKDYQDNLGCSYATAALRD